MIFPTTSNLLALFAILALFPQTTMAAPSRTFPRVKRQDEQTANQLDPGQVMNGLKQDGQAVADPGQVASLTSENNFINFCLTQNVPLTNGKQVPEGSCNPTIMGRIIAADKMLACKFQFPPNGDTSIQENTAFNIQLRVENFQTGSFSNPQTNFNAAPQNVNDQGFLIGHSHVVIEQVAALDATDTLDPLGFKFFKGLNAPANNGILETEVTEGLPAGFYRLSSINTAFTHQPALVAVAQHGTLDDGVYFEVKAAGAGGDNAGDGANAAGAGQGGAQAGGAQAGGAQAGGAQGGGAAAPGAAAPGAAAPGAAAPGAAAPGAAAPGAAAPGGNQAGNQGGGRGGNRGGRNRGGQAGAQGAGRGRARRARR